MSSTSNLPEMPTWLRSAMTPLVVVLAIAGAATQWLGLLSSPNIILVAYVTALLLSTAWAGYVLRAKRSSSLVGGIAYPAYSQLHKIASVASTLTLVVILVVHVAVKPKSFVLQPTEPFDVSESQIVSVTVTAQGLDIKLKNPGSDTAFVHELWLAIDDARWHPAPCAIAIESMATYDYPFKLAHGTSTINPASFKGVARSSKFINRRLVELLKNADQSAALDKIYWAAEPLNISQAVPPKSVDRFLVRLTPSGNLRMADNCDGGLHYNAKIFLVYDKSRVSVSDWFMFTLTRTQP